MPVCSLFSAILLLLLDVTVNIPYRSVNRSGAIKSDADMTGTRLKTHIPIPMQGQKKLIAGNRPDAPA
jgi:hypothetical protein